MLENKGIFEGFLGVNMPMTTVDIVIKGISTGVFFVVLALFLVMMITGKDTKGKVVGLILAMLVVPSVTYLGLYTIVYGDFVAGVREFLEISKYGFEV